MGVRTTCTIQSSCLSSHTRAPVTRGVWGKELEQTGISGSHLHLKVTGSSHCRIHMTEMQCPRSSSFLKLIETGPACQHLCLHLRIRGIAVSHPRLFSSIRFQSLDALTVCSMPSPRRVSILSRHQNGPGHTCPLQDSSSQCYNHIT